MSTFSHTVNVSSRTSSSFQWWCMLKFCWWNEYFTVFCKCVAWNNASGFFPCMFFKNSKQQWAFNFNVIDPSNSLNTWYFKQVAVKLCFLGRFYSKSITWKFWTFLLLEGNMQSIGNVFLVVWNRNFIVSLNSFKNFHITRLLKKTQQTPLRSFFIIVIYCW